MDVQVMDAPAVSDGVMQGAQVMDAPAVSHSVMQGAQVTSARALDRHGMQRRQNQTQRIFDLVRDHQLRGVADMTGAEIVAAYERQFGQRIETGRVAARLSELIAADRLARRDAARVCTVTGYEARPVCVVPHQARLVA